jgi:SAM-dependent methyltransferase
MLFNNPLGAKRADELARLLALSAGDRVLDVGCGRGEFLIRVIEAAGCRGFGIENAEGRVPAERCEFRSADMKEISLEPASFAAGICLGSTHAFASGESAYPQTLESLAKLIQPGGQALIGEGYWKQAPAPEYLELLGQPVGIYRDHAGNIELATRLGWKLVSACESSFQEWDDFEAAHAAKIASEAAGDPGNAALAARLAHSRRWYDGYQRWGRTTMGFGFYLFHQPG